MEGSCLLPGSGTHIPVPGNVIHRRLDLQGERGKTLSHFTDPEATPGAQAVTYYGVGAPPVMCRKLWNHGQSRGTTNIQREGGREWCGRIVCAKGVPRQWGEMGSLQWGKSFHPGDSGSSPELALLGCIHLLKCLYCVLERALQPDRGGVESQLYQFSAG